MSTIDIVAIVTILVNSVIVIGVLASKNDKKK